MNNDQAENPGDWLIVDPMTGAMWTLAAEAVGDRLGRRATAQRAVHGWFSVSRVAVLGEVPPDLLGHMVPYKRTEG